MEHKEMKNSSDSKLQVCFIFFLKISSILQVKEEKFKPYPSLYASFDRLIPLTGRLIRTTNRFSCQQPTLTFSSFSLFLAFCAALRLYLILQPHLELNSVRHRRLF